MSDFDFRKINLDFDAKLGSKKVDKFIKIFIAVYLIAFSALLSSQSNQLMGRSIDIDSGVFMTIAKGITLGKVPYLDFFDHKGPFLYFLNYVGYSLGGVHGVGIVEFISIFISVLSLYFCTKILFGKLISVLSVTSGFLLLRVCFERGNFTEEYALPLICAALWIYIRITVSDSFRLWEVLICGFTFGLSVLLRPNMFSVWFVFSVFIVVKSFLKKDIKKSLNYIIFFVTGTVLALAPFMIYLMCKGAFSEYIYQNFIFNSQYVNVSKTVLLKNLYHAVFSLSDTTVLAAVICILVFFDKKRTKPQKTVFFVLLASIVLSALIISVSNAHYQHYYMVLIPVIAVSLSAALEKIREVVSESLNGRFFSNAIIACLCFFVVSGSICSIAEDTFMSIMNPADENEEIKCMVEMIENNAQKDDTIQVIGNECRIYLFTDLKPASKYIYDSPIANISEDVHNEFSEKWKENPPTFVIQSINFKADNNHKKWVASELEDNYDIFYESENYKVYTER